MTTSSHLVVKIASSNCGKFTSIKKRGITPKQTWKASEFMSLSGIFLMEAWRLTSESPLWCSQATRWIFVSSLMQIFIRGIPPRSSIATMFSPQRRVSILEWHPTAENVLLSASHDHSLILWNVARGDPVQVVGTELRWWWFVSELRLGLFHN